MLNILLSIVIAASLDSTTLFMGDQCDLHLQATAEPTEQVFFPAIGEMLQPEIEVVDRTIIDTTRLKDGRVQYDQYLTVTSFKDSLFYIEPLAFTTPNGETIYSDALSLNVIQPFEMDTTLAITDIKDIQKAPIWWWGIIRWILQGLLLAGLGVGLYFAWKKWGYLLKGTEKPVEAEPVILRPAEEVALEKLDIIKAEKVWQNGQVKEYHTELTDVVREYISRRFEVSSTEKTSDETLAELKPLMKEQKSLYEALKKMLTTADLVKFAKWTTTPDENELSLRTAYDFVHETTPVNENDNENAN